MQAYRVTAASACPVVAVVNRGQWEEPTRRGASHDGDFGIGPLGPYERATNLQLADFIEQHRGLCKERVYRINSDKIPENS